MASLMIEPIAQLATTSHSAVPRVLDHHSPVQHGARDERIIENHSYALPTAIDRRMREQMAVLGPRIPCSTAPAFSDPFVCSIIYSISRACTQHGSFVCSALSAEARQAAR